MPTSRAVILGSGPSLRSVDMRRLSAEPTIAFNRAHIAFEQWGFDPTYYACIDRNALPTNRDAIVRMLESSDVRHVYLRDTARRFGLPNDPRVTYVHVHDEPVFSTDFGALGMFGNVAAVSVQILAALGYRRLLLLGIDGGYSRSDQVEQLESRYDLQALRDDDSDHFRADYHGRGVRFTRPNNERFQEGWKRLVEAAEARGLELILGSPDSAVDCLPRLDWDTAWHRYVRP